MLTIYESFADSVRSFLLKRELPNQNLLYTKEVQEYISICAAILEDESNLKRYDKRLRELIKTDNVKRYINASMSTHANLFIGTIMASFVGGIFLTPIVFVIGILGAIASNKLTVHSLKILPSRIREIYGITKPFEIKDK